MVFESRKWTSANLNVGKYKNTNLPTVRKCALQMGKLVFRSYEANENGISAFDRSLLRNASYKVDSPALDWN
jgi:hypothetical protein